MAMSVRQAAASDRRRHRFSLDEYHRMVEAGIFDGDRRVELIAGEVVEMSAMGARHGRTLEYLVEEIPKTLPPELVLRVQTPLTIPGSDEPEPDLMVVRRRADRYIGGHPQPSDVVLVIEISDTTLAYDRGVKLAVYARAGLPETWIANLASREGGVLRYTGPNRESGTYRRETHFARGDEIQSEVLPSLALPVEEILGPPYPAVGSST